MYTPKTEKIKLFNLDLILTERTAWDVNKLIQFSQENKEKDFKYYIIESSIVLSDALKNNWINLKWYEFIKKRKLNRLLSKENILQNLPSKQIFELAKKVYEIEGVVEDGKKKVKRKAAESVATPQSV